MGILAAVLLAWLTFGRAPLASATDIPATTTTLPPQCDVDEDCDDHDNCTDDTCDDNGFCQHAPVPIDEQGTCIIDNLHDILDGPPALACAGHCRCTTLGSLVDRADNLISAAADATTLVACKRNLRAVDRTALRARRRLERLALHGCLAPVERITQADDQFDRLIERSRQLPLEGFCLP